MFYLHFARQVHFVGKRVRDRMVSAVVLVSFVLPCTLLAREPSCSKFDYEEKTLEKMIRLDIKCEAILADVTALKQEVNNAVLGAKMELEKKIGDIDKTLSDMSKLKKDVQDQIQTVISGQRPTIVTFKAEMSQTIVVSRRDVLKFHNVVSNHGDGYDSDTGIFTAPVGGIYLFTIQLCIEHQDNMVVETVVDGKVTNHVLFYDNVRDNCYDHTDILMLGAGNTVTFKVGADSTSSVKIQVTSSVRTNFVAGVLVVKQ